MNVGIAVVLVTLCHGSSVSAAVSSPDLVTLRRALRTYAIAVSGSPRAFLEPQNAWSESYLRGIREKGIPAAIDLLAEEAALQPERKNSELLYGLNSYLHSNAMSLGKEADVDASKIIVGIRQKYCFPGKDIEERCPEWKKSQGFNEVAAWRAWWSKYQHEEFIFNFVNEVYPEVTESVLQFVRGTSLESRAAADRLDALSPRRRAAYDGLVRVGALSDMSKSRLEASIYLKRCSEIVTGKIIPLPEPRLSASQDEWQKWDKAIYETWGNTGAIGQQWPSDFWKTLDRKKISQPIAK